MGRVNERGSGEGEGGQTQRDRKSESERKTGTNIDRELPHKRSVTEDPASLSRPPPLHDLAPFPFSPPSALRPTHSRLPFIPQGRLLQTLFDARAFISHFTPTFLCIGVREDRS